MIKSLLREVLFFFSLDLTKNLAYDRLSRQLIRKCILPDDNCVDVGAHTGDVLKFIAKQVPKGQHMAFEPIPQFYEYLKSNWEGRVRIYPYALSDTSGKSEFQWVKNAPAYSGLKKRQYKVRQADIETIEVETRRLDGFKNPEKSIRFIKIDVEGAELLVLNGALEILRTDRPFILFEFGLGASEYYKTTTKELYQFFNTKDYGLFTLKDALKKKPALNFDTFDKLYKSNSEYYFWAAPK